MCQVITHRYKLMVIYHQKNDSGHIQSYVWIKSLIQDIKRQAQKIIQVYNTPVQLWCFCCENSEDLLSLLANGRFDPQGMAPCEGVMHYTLDTLDFISFGWFQFFWYFYEGSRSKCLYRWIGPAHQVEKSFCSYLILEKLEYIAQSSVIPIHKFNFPSIEMKERMKKCMESLEYSISD